MQPPNRVQMKVGEFYTVQGAAQALGLSYWTVYRYVRVERVPTIRVGNQMLLRLEDLQALVPPVAPASPVAPATPRGGTAAPGNAAPAGSPVLQAGSPGHQAGECPECGSRALVHEEGCQKCLACGYSVC